MSFAIRNAQPLMAGEPLQVCHLWLGLADGELVGVITNPPVGVNGSFPRSESAIRLHHISGFRAR